jgi:hypothetical protein
MIRSGSDQVRQFVFRLQEQRDEGDGAQRTVRELVRSELVLGIDLPPIEQNARRIKSARREAEVLEERDRHPNGGADSLVA